MRMKLLVTTALENLYYDFSLFSFVASTRALPTTLWGYINIYKNTTKMATRIRKESKVTLERKIPLASLLPDDFDKVSHMEKTEKPSINNRTADPALQL